MHAVNEFVSAWWGLIAFVLGLAWAALALWVRAKIGDAEKEVDGKIVELKQEISAQVGTFDEKLANITTELAKTIREQVSIANSAITMLNERVAKSEARCETLTPAADFHNALLKIGEIGGDIKAIKAELVAVHGEQRTTQRSVDRINDFLLEAKK